MNINNNSGVTLIELLVAMLIAIVLMIGTVQMFNSNTRAYRLIDQMKLIEENGRIGMDIMAREVRGASTSTGGVPIYVWDNDNTNNNPAQVSSVFSGTALGVLPGTDVIEVFVSHCSEELNIPAFNENSAAAPQLPVDIIASCLPCYNSGDGGAALAACAAEYSIRIHNPATGYHCQNNITDGTEQGTTRVNLTWNRGVNNDDANRPHQCADPSPGNTWPAVALIGKDVYYYVRDETANRPSQLMRYQVGQVPEAIANHVNDFQVLVGEDSNAPFDKVIDSWGDGITIGTDVTAVKLSLLMKAPKAEKERQDALPTTLENSTVSSLGTADKHRRRVITRTVRLRNMN